MKNKGEIYAALLHGKIIINDGVFKAKLDDKENLISVDTGRICDASFSSPQYWEIYEEPKWYENIPKGGILCKFKNNIIVLIFSYDTTTHKVSSAATNFSVDILTPITSQEIQVFKDNVPEEFKNADTRN